MARPDPAIEKVSFERERGVYGLHIARDVAQIACPIDRAAGRAQSILRVVRALAEGGVPVFFMKLHPGLVTLACSGPECTKAEAALQAAGIQVSARHDLAVVSIRATLLEEVHRVVVAIADAMDVAGVRLYEIGDSHSAIQCLIDAAHLPAAVDALRRAFSLDQSSVVESGVDGSG